jgi:hypothetical protein
MTVVPMRKGSRQDVAAEATVLPAKPYEPTPQEAKVLAQYAKQKAARRPVPRMKVNMSKGQSGPMAALDVDHEDRDTGYRLLTSAIAMDDWPFAKGLIDSLASCSQDGSAVKEQTLNFGISIVAGIRPKDHVEALLASQMAAVHIATMNTAARLGGSNTQEMWFGNEKAFNRLARTFAAQVEALKRYRSKGEQRVYVERVNVEQGGQAIVGPVSRTGGGGDDDQSDR